MFPSFGYALVFCLMISTGFSRSRPDNSKQSLAKTTKMQEKQSFVVNNNCGLGQNERQTLSHIKEKIDKIAPNVKDGKFLKWYLSPKKLTSCRNILYNVRGNAFFFSFFFNFMVEASSKSRFVFFYRICLFYWLVSTWKVVLHCYRYSNQGVERCETKLPEIWRRSRKNHL